MKNIKLIAGIFFILIAFTFTSCENEPVDSTIVLSDGGTGGGTGGGGTGGGGGTSAGDYWPAALNNQWVYKQNGVEQSPMKMISINSIGGNTYYTFNNLFGASSTGTTAAAVSRLRKNSGDYYMKVEDLTIDLGGGMTGQMTGFEAIILKDYLSVGQTWNGSYTQTTTYDIPGIPAITTTTNYTGTITETGSSLTVNGVTFNNIIRYRLHQSTSLTGVPASELDTDYWFAKDVGPIKYITYNSGTSTPQYTTELLSYQLN